MDGPTGQSPSVRVVLAHDYLTQRGGAERVALTMARAFPGVPLYTSVYEPDQTFEGFRDVPVRTSSLQHIPAIRRDPRIALPALPFVWNSMKAQDADVVLASSSGWAHAIGVPEGARKIVYCHNPARWLYQSQAYEDTRRRKMFLRLVAPRLRAWDRSAAASADLYLTNSRVVADRVRQVYGIDPVVLHPPVLVDATAPARPIPGLEPGFWLTIGRGRSYKRTQILVEGTRLLGRGRLVIVGGVDLHAGDPHVTCLGVVADDQLRWLYANARALVSVSDEDFGLTPLEANAFGTPVAVLRAGGFVETTLEGVSGVFIEAADPDAVRDALTGFPQFDEQDVRGNAERFSVVAFTARLRALVAGFTAS
jgi:glycosyltransferase involved in cell wall biosynthesis